MEQAMRESALTPRLALSIRKMVVTLTGLAEEELGKACRIECSF